MKVKALEVHDREKDAANVLNWRRECISKLGFEGGVLDKLVESEVDLHYLDHLVNDLHYTPEQVKRLVL